MISDEYCIHTGKHRDDFEYEDWYWYFIEHGATPDLAKKMAENKRPMVKFVNVSKEDYENIVTGGKKNGI